MSKKLITIMAFFILSILFGLVNYDGVAAAETPGTGNFLIAAVSTPEGTNRANIETGEPGIIEKDPNKLIDAAYLIFNIVFVLAGIALAIFIILRAFDLRKKDTRERADGAMSLLYLAVAGVLIFGVWFFIGIMRGIASKLGG